jgi:hypothetical protein
MEDNLNADWHNPSGRDIDEIMNSVKGSKDHLDDSKYGTPKAFVERYAVALEEYLNDSAGKGESHIHDFATLTLSFTEAFFHTVNNFS